MFFPLPWCFFWLCIIHKRLQCSLIKGEGVRVSWGLFNIFFRYCWFRDFILSTFYVGEFFFLILNFSKFYFSIFLQQFFRNMQNTCLLKNDKNEILKSVLVFTFYLKYNSILVKYIIPRTLKKKNTTTNNTDDIFN
jgi:hypothetical protein